MFVQARNKNVFNTNIVDCNFVLEYNLYSNTVLECNIVQQVVL